ncbi:MAG TPA: S-methyl-5-thioribose-1-phosphate isomerase [Candidatus Limiplasma sp.]|nr:S-methyl-5-thioribose-1-phosphate isomerase [Candidatus Limiplasma sp.]HRX09618.1 S-methyl-5-thioribose-1-phosphate isomerase [Candidatus Limiplasma sp.]
MNDILPFETVTLDDENSALVLIDQTRLPNDVVMLRLQALEDIREAIRSLQVRGAPAIGVAAAFGLYLAAKQSKATTFADFAAELKSASDTLNTARPTAVNLSWALRRMEAAAHRHQQEPVARIQEILYQECMEIYTEDIAMCRQIGEHGLTLLKDGDGILTHCNAGRLATSKYGTALAPVHLGQERGMRFKVYADETRPLLQGARLTAFELMQSGVDVTVLCDNMASQVMKNGWVQAVLVGCDRVARNGDVCNKIGTSALAILAKHYGIPFYVLGPSSTLDFSIETGDEIVIEQRGAEEVTQLWYQRPMAPPGVSVYNPAFDITPHELITAIVTEKGIIRPPYADTLSCMEA